MWVTPSPESTTTPVTKPANGRPIELYTALQVSATTTHTQTRLHITHTHKQGTTPVRTRLYITLTHKNKEQHRSAQGYILLTHTNKEQHPVRTRQHNTLTHKHGTTPVRTRSYITPSHKQGTAPGVFKATYYSHKQTRNSTRCVQGYILLPHTLTRNNTGPHKTIYYSYTHK